jgi:predicted transcriptional regulator
MLNGPQIRAARAWLDLSQEELAEITGVAKRTIARIEKSLTVPHDRTLREIQQALESRGVVFIFESGVGIGLHMRSS